MGTRLARVAGHLLAALFLTGLAVARPDPALGAGGTPPEVVRRLLQLLQSDSPHIDQAFVLDLSGSVDAILPISRRMMREFVSAHGHEGDTLVVVAVGTRPEVVVDAVTLDDHNRADVLRTIETLSASSFGPDFARYTDLDAAMLRTLQRLDNLNRARVEVGAVPHRQVIETFSDFVKEPPPTSPHVRPGSAASRTLAALSRRLVLLRTMDAARIQTEHAIDLHGVPLAIQQSEFRAPGAASVGRAVGSFEAWLEGLAARFDPRAGMMSGTGPSGAAPGAMQAALEGSIRVGNPENFRPNSDGPGLVADLPVANDFRGLQVRDFGAVVVPAAAGATGVLDVVLPAGRGLLGPASTLSLEVVLPGLEAPPWHATEPALYASQSFSIQLQGTLESLATGSPEGVALEQVMGPVTRTLSLEIPPDPLGRQVLIGLACLLVLGLSAFAARQLLGPGLLVLEVDVLEADTQDNRKEEVALARGGSWTLGGARPGQSTTMKKAGELFRLVRSGADAVVESLSATWVIQVDGRPLPQGSRAPLKSRSTLKVMKDHGGELLVTVEVRLRSASQAGGRPAGPGSGGHPAGVAGQPPPLSGEDFPPRTGPRRFS